MAISTQIQNLNLIPGKSAPVVVHLSQGNVGNTVQFYLYDGDNPYYPTNVSIAVHGVRADNTVFGPYVVSVTSGSNLVSFDIVTAMTSVTGAAIGELVISDNNENQIGSANFGMLVEATPYSSSVTYEDDLSIYQRILAYVQSNSAETNRRINNVSVALDNAKSESSSTHDSINGRIDFLQTRIDQIVAPSGEAPSTAEILDARIGLDGTTYTTLGESIRSQNANPKLNNCVDYLTTNTRNLVNLANAEIGVAWNGSKNTARAVVAVPVTPNTDYTISFGNNVFDAISWFELTSRTDSQTIVGYTISTSPTTKTTKSNANIILLQFNKSNITFSDIESARIQIEKGTTATSYIPGLIPYGTGLLEQSTEKGANLFDVNKFTNGKEYTGYGSLIDSSVVGISDFIPIVSGKTIKMSIDKSDVPNYRIYYMVEFSASKTFLRRVNVSTTSEYTPSKDAEYFVAEMVPSIIYKVKLEYDVASAWTQYVDSSDLANFGLMASVNMFGSIAGVGDSYTAGMSFNSSGTGVDMHEQSYIATMGKRSGVEWENFGVSGTSAETYITNQNGLPRVLAADPFDLYIINLGQNDINAGHDEGTIADIHDDWTQNANTYCGNMGKIIAQIKNHAPKAKLILVKSWLNTFKYGTDVSYQSLDDSIQAIADYFHIPCISPFDDKFFNSAYYIPFRVQGHPTTMGYSMMGLAMERLFSKCVLNNPDYFMYSTV